MLSVCFVVPGLPHSPGVTGQIGDHILEDVLKIFIHLKFTEQATMLMLT